MCTQKLYNIGHKNIWTAAYIKAWSQISFALDNKTLDSYVNDFTDMPTNRQQNSKTKPFPRAVSVQVSMCPIGLYDRV